MSKKLLEEGTIKRWKKLAGLNEADMSFRQASTVGPTGSTSKLYGPPPSPAQPAQQEQPVTDEVADALLPAVMDVLQTISPDSTEELAKKVAVEVKSILGLGKPGDKFIAPFKLRDANPESTVRSALRKVIEKNQGVAPGV